jgi:hypothetical protein
MRIFFSLSSSGNKLHGLERIDDDNDRHREYTPLVMNVDSAILFRQIFLQTSWRKWLFFSVTSFDIFLSFFGTDNINIDAHLFPHDTPSLSRTYFFFFFSYTGFNEKKFANVRFGNRNQNSLKLQCMCEKRTNSNN